MRTLSIGFGAALPDSNTEIDDNILKLQHFGLEASGIQSETGYCIEIKYSPKVLSNISLALADCIIEKYERELIHQTLSKSYSFLTGPEKRIIIESIRNKKELKGVDTMVNSLLIQQRKLKIAREIADYFEQHDELNLDGFVHFRIKEYRDELEELIESRVEQFMVDKEYNEFISLLKAFVDSRKANSPIMHVVFYPSNTYTLLDHELTPVELEQSYLHDSILIQQNCDTLAGVLVETLPEKIILHNANLYCKPELLETLRCVFTWRVEICKGCKICLH